MNGKPSALALRPRRRAEVPPSPPALQHGAAIVMLLVISSFDLVFLRTRLHLPAPFVVALVLAVPVLAVATGLAANSMLLTVYAGLLLAPAMLMTIALVLAGPGNTYFLSPHMLNLQTPEVMLRAIEVTVLFVAALLIGWCSLRDPTADGGAPPRFGFKLDHLTTAAVLASLAFSAWMFVLQAGPSILTAAYTTQTQSTPLQIEVYGPLAAIFLILLELRFPPINRQLLNAMWVLVLGLVFLLHGDRVDALDAGLALLVCRVVSERRRLMLVLMAGVVLYPLLIFMGVFRSVAAEGQTVGQAWDTAAAHFATPGGGTVGDVAMTSVGSIYLVDSGSIAPMRGGSYLDYLGRTLPAFIYPGRPDSLASIFADHGLSSGGGITPPGESYLNFGVYGAILVGGVLGAILAWIERRRFRGPVCFAVYIFAAGTAFRACFYQLFGLYKVEVVLLFIASSLALYERLSHREVRPAVAWRRAGLN